MATPLPPPQTPNLHLFLELPEFAIGNPSGQPAGVGVGMLRGAGVGVGTSRGAGDSLN